MVPLCSIKHVVQDMAKLLQCAMRIGTASVECAFVCVRAIGEQDQCVCKCGVSFVRSCQPILVPIKHACLITRMGFFIQLHTHVPSRNSMRLYSYTSISIACTCLLSRATGRPVSFWVSSATALLIICSYHPCIV